MLSKKSGVFLAVKVEYKKRDTPERMSNEMQMLTRRFSAAALASARCSQNIEAAGTPDPNKVSGRHAPNRGCQRQLTGVEIVAKKKPGG